MRRSSWTSCMPAWAITWLFWPATFLPSNVTVLHEGRVLTEGTPDEIQRNDFVQDAYLGGVAAAE